MKLENKAKIEIDKEYLDKILASVKLPDGKILLVLYDSHLPDCNQGACVPRARNLLKFARPYKSIFNSQNDSWDCGIAIARKWCDNIGKFPSYFTYLLGHELGHAYICLSDIDLHIHCCVIHLCIRHASKDKIRYPHQLPDEQMFDQFGKYLVSEIHHQTNELDNEIEKISVCVSDVEKDNLEQLKSLVPSNNLKDLRKKMIDFTLPYKDCLIDCWKKLVERDGEYTIVSLINNDYEKLFNY